MTDHGKGGRFHISVDVKKCIGAGQCVRAAPKIFTQDAETGLVVLMEPEPAHDQEDAAKDAAELCPAEVIAIREKTY